jgi:hypothetical protein
MSFSDLSDDAIYHIREFLGDTLRQVNTRMSKMFKCIEIHVSTTVTEVYLGVMPYEITLGAYNTKQVEQVLLTCGRTTIGEDNFSFEFTQTTTWHTTDDYDAMKDLLNHQWVFHYMYKCGDQALTILCNNKQIHSDDFAGEHKDEQSSDDKNELCEWAKGNSDYAGDTVLDTFCDHVYDHLAKLDGDIRRYFIKWSFS